MLIFIKQMSLCHSVIGTELSISGPWTLVLGKKKLGKMSTLLNKEEQHYFVAYLFALDATLNIAHSGLHIVMHL